MEQQFKFLFIESEKCNGCRICELRCSFFHEGVYSPTLSRIHVVKWELDGIDVPVACRQCVDAPCIRVCPTGAVTKSAKPGAIQIDESKCIGCKMCVVACPFGAMMMHPKLNIAMTCDLCDGDPQCAKYCPENAIHYMTPKEFADYRRKEKARKVAGKVEKRSAIPQVD